MKSIFEGLKPVKEDEFRKIYLSAYHYIVHAESIFVTNIVFGPPPYHHHVEQKTLNEYALVCQICCSQEVSQQFLIITFWMCFFHTTTCPPSLGLSPFSSPCQQSDPPEHTLRQR